MLRSSMAAVMSMIMISRNSSKYSSSLEEGFCCKEIIFVEEGCEMDLKHLLKKDLEHLWKFFADDESQEQGSKMDYREQRQRRKQQQRQ
jgi:hypothetical protein